LIATDRNLAMMSTSPNNQRATEMMMNRQKAGITKIIKDATIDKIVIPAGEHWVAENLAEVSGNIYLYEDARLTAHALAKSGYIHLRQDARFTAHELTEVSGDIYLRQGARLTARALTEVSGDIYLRQGARLTAPALAASNGTVYHEVADCGEHVLFHNGEGLYKIRMAELDRI
jgi:hypothetical protein